MIYAAILDTRRAQGLLPLRCRLDEYFLRRIEETKNIGLRNERVAAYSLLTVLYEKLYGKPLPPIEIGEMGKPRLLGVNIGISLSHTEGFAAAVINDGGEVGADIEAQMEKERAERVGERFLKDISLAENENFSLPIVLISLTLTKDGELDGASLSALSAGTDKSFKSDELHDGAVISAPCKDGDEKNLVLHKWTAAESVLKLNGYGFNDYKSLHIAQKNAKTYTYEISSHGEIWSFSVSAYAKG